MAFVTAAEFAVWFVMAMVSSNWADDPVPSICVSAVTVSLSSPASFSRSAVPLWSYASVTVVVVVSNDRPFTMSQEVPSQMAFV
jgi:hypothetical protein